jgi:hypothetical protein
MNGSHVANVGRKQKVVHELHELAVIFVYLSIFFYSLNMYTRLISASAVSTNFVYGLGLLKSLALAKVILTGEAMRLGERYRDRPLIVPTVYKTVVFIAFVLAFEVLEHFILGWIEGKHLAKVWTELLDKGWAHTSAQMVLVFVAFLPFFAFRETERVLGERKLRDLFLRRRVA